MQLRCVEAKGKKNGAAKSSPEIRARESKLASLSGRGALQGRSGGARPVRRFEGLTEVFPHRFISYSVSVISYLLPGGQGDHHTQGEQAVLCLKGAKSCVVLGHGLNAAAAVAVSVPVGERQAVVHDHPADIGISDLEEQLVLPDLAVEFHPPVGHLGPGGRMQGIFQPVGHHRAQLGVGQGEGLGQPGLYGKPHLGAPGLAVVGGAEQIDRFILTELLRGDGIQIAHGSLDKLLCLSGLAAGQQAVQYNKPMAHIMPIDRHAGIGLTEQRDLFLGGVQLMLQRGLGRYHGKTFPKGTVHIGQQEIEQEDQDGGDEAYQDACHRGQGSEVQIDRGEHIEIVSKGCQREQQKKPGITVSKQIGKAVSEHELCKQQHQRLGDHVGQKEGLRRAFKQRAPDQVANEDGGGGEHDGRQDHEGGLDHTALGNAQKKEKGRQMQEEQDPLSV